jgi:hypothetical protein
MRRLLHGREPLVHAFIGAAERADFSIGPRLRGAPFDCVVTILAIGAIGNKVAIRIASAANVFVNDDVTFRDEFADAIDGSRAAARLHVRSSSKDGREFSGRVGAVNVGGELDGVAHLDAHAELNLHGVSRLNGRSGILGDSTSTRRGRCVSGRRCEIRD